MSALYRCDRSACCGRHRPVEQADAPVPLLLGRDARSRAGVTTTRRAPAPVPPPDRARASPGARTSSARRAAPDRRARRDRPESRRAPLRGRPRTPPRRAVSARAASSASTSAFNGSTMAPAAPRSIERIRDVGERLAIGGRLEERGPAAPRSSRATVARGGARRQRGEERVPRPDAGDRHDRLRREHELARVPQLVGGLERVRLTGPEHDDRRPLADRPAASPTGRSSPSWSSTEASSDVGVEEQSHRPVAVPVEEDHVAIGRALALAEAQEVPEHVGPRRVQVGRRPSGRAASSDRAWP